jgi:hypothetical protein
MAQNTVLMGRLSLPVVSDDVFGNLFADEMDEPEDDGSPRKPQTRSECVEGVRPCPWVSCRFNLYLDVRGDGVLRLNFPDREPDEMLSSCALDLAEDGPRTLEQVAGLMGMSKERARQLEAVAMDKMRGDLGHGDVDYDAALFD